jgi:hypothetical protein
MLSALTPTAPLAISHGKKHPTEHGWWGKKNTKISHIGRESSRTRERLRKRRKPMNWKNALESIAFGVSA